MRSTPSALANFPHIEGYRGLRRLGQGASAVVFEAIEQASGEHVALKIPRRSDPASIARLQREARALGRVAHPALVGRRGPVPEAAPWWLAMDLVQGGPFLEATRSQVVLPAASLLGSSTIPVAGRHLSPCPADVPRLRRALGQLAEGLTALHGAGLVHRDIKDANVLVGPDGQLRLLDFGLALALDDPQLASLDDTHAGTPLYLSPEQARGDPASPASDWYAVGVLLYEALAGRPPFAGEIAPMLAAKSAVSPPAPSSIVAGVPPGLEALCLALLDSDPARRAGAAQIREALGGEGEQAKIVPPGAAEMGVKEPVSHDVSAPSEGKPALPPGTVLGGAYTIRRFLAEGAMGAVYEAEDATGQIIALKTLLWASAPGLVQRFFREVRLASALSHPNLLTVYKGGRDEVHGVAFMAMELLQGEDLSAILARTGALPEPVALRIAVDAARAVAVAHEAGVVHRDLKPSNLFSHRQGDEIIVKVCDFGIARSLDPDDPKLTRTGSVVGSPLYMAPEALSPDKGPGVRADVWSLAMTLYEMLTGACPTARADSLSALLVMVCTEDMPHLQDTAPWVRPEVAEAVLGGVLRDEQARCPSMDELAAALSPLARPAPLTAADLRPLTDEEKAHAAPRGVRPARWATRVVIKAPEDPLVGKVLAGKYTLEARLGEGGMGAVYRARNTSDEPVAIKVIRPDRAGTSPDATRRFVREARVAMAIQSPHVVRVLEVDSDAALGAPYIVMDLLVGQDLSSQIERKGPLDAGVVCALFAQACAGLTAAHEAGVVHRDIKPANLFLHEQGDAVVVKVCDFGIAKKTSEFAGAESTASELTSTGGMLGSPYYMSPEQARNAKGVDARSDLWSLSISLYEALAGQRPWPSQMSLGELIFTITTQDVPPLAAAAPWVPEALCALVHRGLHRDPALRWGSAREMREALLPFAAATSIAREGLLSVPPAQREAASRRRPVSAAQTEAQPSTVRSLRRSRSTPLLALGGMLVAGLAAGIAWQSRPSAAVVGASAATTAGDPAAVSLSGSATSLAALPSGEPSPPTASVAAVPASASASATPALAPTGKRVSKSEPTTAHTASPQPATPTPGGSAFPVQKVWRE